MPVEMWTCVCGKSYPINGQKIVCVGVGHSVIIMPAYFTYRLPVKKITDTNKPQYGLF